MKRNRGRPYKSKSKEIDTLKVLQGARTILCNFHRDTFEHHLNRLKKLSFNSEEKIKGVTKLIFDRAIHHLRFTESCARVCLILRKDLSNVRLKASSSNDLAGDEVFFTLLSHRCLMELEVKDERIKQKEQKLKAATGVPKFDHLITYPHKKRHLLRLRLNKAKEKALQRSMANIHFICELYKLKILHVDTLHSYVSSLLSTCSPDSLEQVCRLLYLVGRDLNIENKPCLDLRFTYIQDIIRENRAPHRHCNMMKGLLDLHQNDWIPKRLRT